MRSDYLGDCAQIPGLAEVVNDGCDALGAVQDVPERFRVRRRTSHAIGDARGDGMGDEPFRRKGMGDGWTFKKCPACHVGRDTHRRIVPSARSGCELNT